MAYFIDLATGRTCGPAIDEGSEDDRYIATRQLQLALQPVPAEHNPSMPLDLVNTDPDSFMAAMEKP